jgi:hypothetical protein
VGTARVSISDWLGRELPAAGARDVLRYADHYEENLTSESSRQLAALARAWFDQEAPNTKTARDLLEHIDQYAIGAGRIELPSPDRWGEIRFVDDQTLEGLLGEVTYDFGGVRAELNRLGEAAIHLAAVLHSLWQAEVLGG